jgi:hypothetical protein
MLADEQPGSEQIEILRSMSGQDRLKVAERLYWSARKMKAAGVRAQHPNWTESQVEAEVRRIFANSGWDDAVVVMNESILPVVSANDLQTTRNPAKAILKPSPSK